MYGAAAGDECQASSVKYQISRHVFGTEILILNLYSFGIFVTTQAHAKVFPNLRCYSMGLSSHEYLFCPQGIRNGNAIICSCSLIFQRF